MVFPNSTEELTLVAKRGMFDFKLFFSRFRSFLFIQSIIVLNCLRRIILTASKFIRHSVSDQVPRDEAFKIFLPWRSATCYFV